MKSAKVSICVPTYKGKEHLAECIASIRAQTFTDFEVVICDDESSDGTLELSRQLAEGDARFRIIPNSRRFGLVGNWNNCVEQARGEWIKFIFQDDIIMPSCLEKLLAACQREGKPFGFCERDFIFENAVSQELRSWFDSHKQKLRFDYQAGSIITAQSAARIVVREPSHNLVGEPTVTLINNSVFRQLGRFDETLIQLCDAEFWCRAMINHGAVFVPESLAAFRIHEKATTALNHGKRVFRMEVLDPLVIRYRFAFSPYFKPVRSPQLTGKSRMTLRKECALNASRAWRQAKLGIESGQSSSASLITEWKSVTSRCPGIQILACLGLVIEFLGRVKRKVGRWILWQDRFK